MKITSYIKIILGGLLFQLTIIGGWAQDFNFSQFTPNRTFYNPAFTGMEKGTFSSTLIYRRLWPMLPGNFSTKHLVLDYKTYNPYGMGLYAISSREGAGFLENTTIGGSYSWRGSLNEISGSFFQLGINASYNLKQIEFDNYTFSDELDEIYGEIYPTSFTTDVEQQNFWDFTIGVLAQVPTIIGHQKVIIHTVGFALHHITRPKETFLNSDARLPMQLTIHGQSEFSSGIYSLDKSSRLRFIPGLVYAIQGDRLISSNSSNNLLYGMDIKTDPLFGGIWYSSQIMNNSRDNYKCIIIKLGLNFKSNNRKNQNNRYKFTYSYDLPTSQFGSSKGGSHEISLSIDLHFKARYKYNIF